MESPGGYLALQESETLIASMNSNTAVVAAPALSYPI